MGSAENPTLITFQKSTFLFKNTREMIKPKTLQPFLPASRRPWAHCPPDVPCEAVLCWEVSPSPRTCLLPSSTQCAHSASVSAKESKSGSGSFKCVIWISKESSWASGTSECAKPRRALLSLSQLPCNFSCKLLDVYPVWKLTSLGLQKWRSSFLDLFVLVHVQLWLEATSTQLLQNSYHVCFWDFF